MAAVFWDVDTQYDFMHADGRLYVPGSQEIIPTLRRLTDHAHTRGIRIVASADDHVAEDREISSQTDWKDTFPEHCMHGTAGQRKIRETSLRNPLVLDPERADPATLTQRVQRHDGDILFYKHTVDVFSNPNVLPVVDALAPQRIVLYGVATDVCDRYAIEGLLRERPRIHLTLVTDAVRAISAGQERALLEDWRRRGVTLATSTEILGGER